MNRQVPKVFEAIWWPHFLLGLFFIAGSSLRAAERAASAPSTNTSTKPLRLAIGGFASVGDERARAERSSRLVDLLTTRLATAAEFEVIERAEIEQVAKEAALSLSRWVKPSEAAQVGRLLRADWLLVGTFMKLGETNCVVGRIVDAQTGVVRDLTCVPDVEADLLRTVGALADFAVGSRRKGSTLEQRVFLGVGGFEDAGVNNRHPELRNDIRLKLEETFQGTTVAVVERTMVNPLLNELRLSMGGMTAPASAAPVALPAFFLVDGTYQSLYEGQQKIELLLRVEEIGGRPGVIKIKAAPGDELLGRVVAVLRSMVRERGLQSPSPANNNEALTQLERGKERARLPRSMDDVTLGGYFAGENDVKRRQNIAEAIEAFEAALLLAPDLTEAKLYLARCFLEPEIGRKDRGRDYLRELIDGNTNAALATTARRKLAESYLEEDDARALQMYSDMARDAHDPGERARIYESMYLPMERLHRRGRFAKEEGFAHLKKLL